MQFAFKQGGDLSAALSQIDSAFADEIFMLSKRYRNEFRNVKVADVLLNWAANKNCTEALEKRNALPDLNFKEEVTPENVSSDKNKKTQPTEPKLIHKSDETQKLYNNGMLKIRDSQTRLEGLGDLKKAADMGDEIASVELENTDRNSPFFRAIYQELDALEQG